MTIIIKGPLKDNVYNLMRSSGYHFLGKDEKTSEMRFARPARGYPRFHIFLKIEGANLVLNLHLDQKKPSYEGTASHAGEYVDGVISKEAERIKQTCALKE